MSSALAIASVTAVLKNLLENSLTERGVAAGIGGEIIVSALPPDRISIGGDERAQINLFLYQVTPNTGLHRSGRAATSTGHSGTPSIALDLHYLVTAYGAADFQIEILLGYALQVLRQTAVLERDVIQQSLASLSSVEGGRVVSPPVAALAESSLAEQVVQINITQQFLTTEDMSKIWSSLQAHYRPSITYKVSVVFIDR